MEDINNLLNAGEVPNLFALDEKQEICEKMRVFDRFSFNRHYYEALVRLLPHVSDCLRSPKTQHNNNVGAT